MTREKAIVDIIGYRQWAKDLAAMVTVQTGGNIHFHEHLDEICGSAELVFLVGWSTIVPPELYASTRPMLVLHPSQLPRYRGGSPIQHQIMEGLDDSMVSIFRLRGEGIDTGPVVWQQAYSLRGQLQEVLDRIAYIGALGVGAVIAAWRADMLTSVAQYGDPVYRPRRRPEESELTLERISGMSGRQLEDFVRALQDPYPNAFIRVGGGARVLLHKATVVSE